MKSRRPGRRALGGTASAPGVRRVTVSLRGSEGAGNEAGFALQRSTDPAFPPAGTASFTLPANAISFVDAGVTPVTTYRYRLRAFNAAGPSAWNEATVVTTGAIPELPSNLAVDGVGTTTIDLSWRDDSADETGFTLERAGAGATVLLTVPAGVTVWRDSGLRRRTRYAYRVRAFNEDGASAWSAQVSATTR